MIALASHSQRIDPELTEHTIDWEPDSEREKERKGEREEEMAAGW